MKKNNKKEQIEDTTKYGEFIPSCFNWITIEKQKEKVRELENITKNKNR
ncbi:MAG: hypothetical protein J6M60_07765 [Clostridia bacterium]|nr:hypothetical protein [Clostridia bacterium]